MFVGIPNKRVTGLTVFLHAFTPLDLKIHSRRELPFRGSGLMVSFELESIK